MNRPLLSSLIFASLLVPSLLNAAEPFEVKEDDTLRSLLLSQQGKSVTLRLKDGGELTGQLRSVGTHTLHLGALSGREFFDAAIPLDTVSALIVRSRDR